MELFLSGEIDAIGVDKPDTFIELSRDITKKLDFVCSREKNLENIDNYGTEFKLIAIITMIVTQERIDRGFKERRYISRKNKEADIRLNIEKDIFYNATPEKQRLLYIKNIIDSINVVIEKSKGDFRGEDLKRDILKALDVTQEQLDNL